LTRLYSAIEDGLVGQGPEGLKDRIRELEAIKVEAKADADRAEAAIEKLGPMITPDGIERMATAARDGLRDADGKYRRAHVRSVAQRVEAPSTAEIKIMGGRTELLRMLAASGDDQSAILEVRSSKPKWRARNDSNVRPSDS
jgi:site-specific DNA recombinase